MTAGVRLPVADARAVRRRAARLVAQERGVVVAVCALAAVAAGAGAAIPVGLGAVVDGLRAGWDLTRVDLVCAALLACVVVQLVCSRTGLLLGHRFGERSAARVREEALDGALRLPLGVVERAGLGDVTTRTTGDVTAVANALRGPVPDVVAAAIEIVVLVVAAAVVGPAYAAALVVVVPPLWFVARRYARLARPQFAAERAASAELAEATAATVAGARSVVAHDLRAARHAAATDAADAHLAARRRIAGLLGLLVPTLDVTPVLAVFLVLAGGGTWAIAQGAPVGAVIACAMLAYRTTGPLERITYAVTDLQSAAAALARIEGIATLAAPPATATTPGGDLEVQDVHFAYDRREVLRGVSLTLRPGEQVVVVGRSGAGKSTLARVVTGIERPQRGTARLGGVTLTDVAPADLRAHVVLVSQETHVFAATLRENLCLRGPVPDERLREVLALVGARWVADLPDGLGTRVGDGGVTLSQAQAQQVALARVLTSDPQVVVLDESFAALDPTSRGTLAPAALDALRGRTVLLVAHQLDAAERADRVVVMADGEVVEDGPPERLAHAGGAYARLRTAWQGGRERTGEDR